MLEMGKIEIGEDVPAIMAGYELCDMQEELWAWGFPQNDKFLIRIASPVGRAYLTSLNPSVVVDAVMRNLDKRTRSENIPLSDGQLVKVAIGKLLERDNVAIYASFPHDYRLILRNPGDTP